MNDFCHLKNYSLLSKTQNFYFPFYVSNNQLINKKPEPKKGNIKIIWPFSTMQNLQHSEPNP